jgi:riboflavin synthase
MFTGIVEETGEVAAFERGEAGARLRVAARVVTADLPVGGSVAVNGCCLTAVTVTVDGFEADLSPETLARTNLGELTAGARVNLERPLLPSSRLSGHFVQGHVDGTGEFLALEPLGDGNWRLCVRAPRDLLPYLVHKGSVAIDGVSLTVAALVDDVVEVAVIPHTFEQTNLGARRPGERVNLEADILAKYVERQMTGRHG